ncbi:uracil-DNA glycosylase family protein [Paenibacillus daejeonensis]|uniref:uracil-DNA glycosylase family protein n=1 Tax=Paenibacillus daejeonensis TaxID=135193 RepID=UPI00036581F3|nr:uracil-DNA glycosylase family protein [Paenibacillus daejeonensis]
MERIIDLHLNFLESLQERQDIMGRMEQEKISVLNGFTQQAATVREFYRRFYGMSTKPRIVLCGINPGRNGAGKTGVPFLDFLSLSKMLPGISSKDRESSAQFIYEVIQTIGRERFFNHVYLTNISWFGFVQKADRTTKNLNYYGLPAIEQKVFTTGFLEEMEIVQPRIILPLSQEVEKSLLSMKAQGLLAYDIGPRLNHPYYCSISTNREKGLADYLNAIEGYIQEHKGA